MTRYLDFDNDSDADSHQQSLQASELICITDLLPIANPLMDKIQYRPYQANHFFPVGFAKLSAGLAEHHYHSDKNHMTLLEQSLFVHQQLKKAVGNCMQGCRKQNKGELQTLKQFYTNKPLIFQKYKSEHQQHCYFATLVLNMARMMPKTKSDMLICKSKTPLGTERTGRTSLSCRSAIQFNSNFQSGNLFKVYQREAHQYDLILQNDINTRGNNQWFFFSVRNVPKATTLKINIVNMTKNCSLFEYGMKPSVFSLMRYEKRKVGWVREGSKVHYGQSVQLKKDFTEQPYYFLSFQYKFIYEGDVVYFSHTMPYTFQNLTNFIGSTLANRQYHKIVRIKSLGQTLGGNEVNMFEVSNFENRQQKKAVWVMGRQHSGETTSSFMMEGIISYLLSNESDAQYLRNIFVFRLVPMVNIDGVVHGNTRAELVGCDSNRTWVDPHKQYQPIIYTLKKMIERDDVEMVLDLHSHSRKLGTFFYANRSNELSSAIKIFPMMVCKNDVRFDYRCNRFRGGSNLTARKVLFDSLKIPHIYTVQSSFFGYQQPHDFKITPYQPKDYSEMGHSILRTLAEMSKKKYHYQIKDQRLMLCNAEELATNDNLWDRMNEADEIQSVGSDQDPAQDQFSKNDMKLVLPVKTKIKTKKKKTQYKPKQIKIIPKETSKKEVELKTTKLEKESHYKKYFSGRLSFAIKRPQSQNDPDLRKRVENKSAAVQVDMPERTVLNRSTLINVGRDRSNTSMQKIFPRKNLCVIGQKVEQQLVIAGLSVGVQAQMTKAFLRNRKELCLGSQSLPKRVLKTNVKVGALMLHNENNFLNRGDTLHSTMRIFTHK